MGNILLLLEQKIQENICRNFSGNWQPPVNKRVSTTKQKAFRALINTNAHKTKKIILVLQ